MRRVTNQSRLPWAGVQSVGEAGPAVDDIPGRHGGDRRRDGAAAVGSRPAAVGALVGGSLAARRDPRTSPPPRTAPDTSEANRRPNNRWGSWASEGMPGSFDDQVRPPARWPLRWALHEPGRSALDHDGGKSVESPRPIRGGPGILRVPPEPWAGASSANWEGSRIPTARSRMSDEIQGAVGTTP